MTCPLSPSFLRAPISALSNHLLVVQACVPSFFFFFFFFSRGRDAWVLRGVPYSGAVFKTSFPMATARVWSVPGTVFDKRRPEGKKLKSVYIPLYVRKILCTPYDKLLLYVLLVLYRTHLPGSPVLYVTDKIHFPLYYLWPCYIAISRRFRFCHSPTCYLYCESACCAPSLLQASYVLRKRT
jgi:hypothetical protein